MRKLLSIATIVVLGFVFQACGQKGPLRLPERAKPVATPVQPAAPSAAPASATPQEP